MPHSWRAGDESTACNKAKRAPEPVRSPGELLVNVCRCLVQRALDALVALLLRGVSLLLCSGLNVSVGNVSQFDADLTTHTVGAQATGLCCSWRLLCMIAS
jgi:hypothetical protein